MIERKSLILTQHDTFFYFNRHKNDSRTIGNAGTRSKIFYTTKPVYPILMERSENTTQSFAIRGGSFKEILADNE